MAQPHRPPVADLVGDTPLVRIPSLEPDAGDVTVHGKLEGANPGGSVKARPALFMIEDGIRQGELGDGQTLVDATSGNTGIAYATLGAAWGIPVALCMPENASEERRRILRAHGAELILTDPVEGQDGAIRRCREIVDEDPGSYFYPDQYNNDANPRSHVETTGPEIWEATDGEVTHLVVGLGTSGTAMGTGRYLKEQAPGIELVGLEPNSPFHGLEGLKHMESSIVPGIFEPKLLDRRLGVGTEASYEEVRRLARQEGLFLGQSSGSAAVAARDLAAELAEAGEGATVVAILPDGGDKYLSTALWGGD
jgi:cysteine synthase B